jgi:hypothetical protein
MCKKGTNEVHARYPVNICHGGNRQVVGWFPVDSTFFEALNRPERSHNNAQSNSKQQPHF